MPTLANAMDVGNPSNLERLQWLFDGDLDAMRGVISSAAHTDEEVRRAIGELAQQYRYVADPHTAIGYFRALGAEARGSAFPVDGASGEVPRSGRARDQQPVPLPDALAATLRGRKLCGASARRWLSWRSCYDRCMSSAAPAPSTLVPARDAIDPKYTWDLNSIFPSWEAWEAAFAELDRGIELYKKYEGTLAPGPDQLLGALSIATRSAS